MPQNLEQYLQVLLHEMKQEGAIVISPRPGEFTRFEQSFLDGVRKIPAVIDQPPGVNPYTYALGKPGRWVFLWVPDKK